ncbi:replication initiation protein, partial [Klebsiella pneumoniae]|nr:replication initiation protein [Klebsiella pneumoniae]
LKRSPSLDAKKTILVPAAHNPADDDALIHKLKMLKAAGYSETEIAGVLDALDKLQREGKPESEVEDADFEEL